MIAKISTTAKRVVVFLISLLGFFVVDSILFFYGQHNYTFVLEMKPEFLNPIIAKEGAHYKLFFQENSSSPFGLREGDSLHTASDSIVSIGEISGYAFTGKDFYVLTVKKGTTEKIKVHVSNFSTSTGQFFITENWEVSNKYELIYRDPIFRIGFLLWTRRLVFLGLIILGILLFVDFFIYLRNINIL